VAGKQLQAEVQKGMQASQSKQPTRQPTPSEGSGNPVAAPPPEAGAGE
jgi:hypothetical protein